MSLFICLEGVDAVGKTEVSKCLASKLGYQYYKSPGSPFVEVRHIVDEKVDPLTRYFFYRASTQNDSRNLAEMLKVSGVVCDRYIYSTFAFHGAMDAGIQSLFERTRLTMPDHTFLLSAREDVRLARLKMRASVSPLEFNVALQRQAERMFGNFGHSLIDTSDTTVEEATMLILKQLEARK